MSYLETQAIPSLRISESNPDHHLWNNHGTWWCHYTLHLPDFTKRRVRRGLGTRDVNLARKRRDHLLQTLSAESAAGFSN